jgi:GNAT superfamily N-acetyltransferase
MPVTYRKAESSDIPVLTEYRIRFLDDSGNGQSAAPVDLQSLRESITVYLMRAIPDENCIVIIAENEGSPVGFGFMAIHTIPNNYSNPSGKIGHILNMYTVPSFRRKGIASEIMRFLIKEAESRGIGKLSLNSTEAGEKIYRKLGFKNSVLPELQLTLKQQ